MNNNEDLKGKTITVFTAQEVLQYFGEEELRKVVWEYVSYLSWYDVLEVLSHIESISQNGYLFYKENNEWKSLKRS